MDERCAWIDRVIGAAAAPDAEVEDHLASCPRCAAEHEAHDALVGAFRGLARPALSPHFRSQVMARVANERRRNRIARRRLFAMRVYWFCAAAVWVGVLTNLNWSPSTSLQSTIVLLAAAALVVPIAAMLVVFRTDIFELILQTVAGSSGELPAQSSTGRLTLGSDGLG